MSAKDTLGCCVIAGRAHQTLHFEILGQKLNLKISDKDITREYFIESGGKDAGLVELDSFSLWRKKRMERGGKKIPDPRLY